MTTGTPLMHRAKIVIAKHIVEHGYAPTRRELAERLGQSVSGANQLIYRMRDRGLIRLHAGWRGIELTRP